MIETGKFKTASMMEERNMPRITGNNQYKTQVIVALDGGYSAVKGISQDRAFCFPSYAKQISGPIDIIGALRPTDVLLTDHITDTKWAVGALAENLIDRNDRNNTADSSLYTRYRYKSDIYRIIMAAGLGMGLLNTDLKNAEIWVQTGLPSTYINRDSEDLKEALAKEYNFTLQIGDREYHFEFALDKEHIGVMEQPKGSMISAVFDKNGEPITEKENILKSNVIIYDIGFGTEDIFSVRSGMNGGVQNAHQTYQDTAMKSVFEATIKEMNETHGSEFKIFEFQKYLEAGKALYFDRENFASKEILFGEILEKYNRELNEKSIHRLMEEYDNLLDYQYLIVTGGTGASRMAYIKDMLKGLPTLTVLAGNDSDTSLSSVFANVRGYYITMYLKLRKQNKQRG